MKTTIFCIVTLFMSFTIFAYGFHPTIRHTTYRPHIHHHVYHRPIYHCHRPYISPWIGLAAGTIVGATIANNINRTVVVEKPVVVQLPVVVQQPVQQPVQVWVPAHYEDQIQANGTTVRVFIPGHYAAK